MLCASTGDCPLYVVVMCQSDRTGELSLPRLVTYMTQSTTGKSRKDWQTARSSSPSGVCAVTVVSYRLASTRRVSATG